MRKGSGWHNESHRHRMSAYGCKTTNKNMKAKGDNITIIDELDIFIDGRINKPRNPSMYTGLMMDGHNHALRDVQNEIRNSKDIADILDFVDNAIENPPTSFLSLNRGYVMAYDWSLKDIKEKIEEMFR